VTWVSLLLLAALGATSPEIRAAHAELDEVATRIEQLKARHAAGEDVGRKLHQLLVRAQELSHVIERAAAPAPRPPVFAPSPEELRERADAGRDEADRIAAAIARVDARLDALQRTASPAPRRASPAEATLASARPADGSASASALAPGRVRSLLAHRALLVERFARVQDEIARLEAEAERLDRAP
jgi:uncharacterized protein YukE